MGVMESVNIAILTGPNLWIGPRVRPGGHIRTALRWRSDGQSGVTAPLGCSLCDRIANCLLDGLESGFVAAAFFENSCP